MPQPAFANRGEAPAPLVVHGGYNHDDPIRDLFEHAALPTEQDPTVGERCAEVVMVAANLCLKYGTDEAVADGGLSWSRLLTGIGNVTYEASSGVSGTISLTTNIQTEKTDSGLYIPYWRNTGVTLWAQADPKQAERLMYSMWPSGMTCGPSHDQYAGRHQDLNFLWGVIEKIRSAVAPTPGPAAVEERRRAMTLTSSGASRARIVETVASL